MHSPVIPRYMVEWPCDDHGHSSKQPTKRSNVYGSERTTDDAHDQKKSLDDQYDELMGTYKDCKAAGNSEELEKTRNHLTQFTLAHHEYLVRFLDDMTVDDESKDDPKEPRVFTGCCLLKILWA